MSVDKISCLHTSVDKMSVDKMTDDKMFVDKMTHDARPGHLLQHVVVVEGREIAAAGGRRGVRDLPESN
jgi:hypothetical protein